MPSEENAHPAPSRYSRPHDLPDPCYHGPTACYGIASRLLRISEDALNLNQGTIYPALVLIEQRCWTRALWAKRDNGREATYCAITRAWLKALEEETERWCQTSGVVKKLLVEEQ